VTLKTVKIRFRRSTLLLITTASAALAALACSSSEPAASAGYWPDAYNALGEPSNYTSSVQHLEEDGHPGACLAGCHEPGGSSTLRLAWGGVVYAADGKTRAAHVQVGVVSGGHKSFVYSRGDGLYWSDDTAAVDWPTADIRIRSANGERPKANSDERDADCDHCHEESGGSALPLTVL
jgi:hypothetical protein